MSDSTKKNAEYSEYTVMTDNKKNSKPFLFIICFAALAVLVAIDQYTKSLAVSYLKDKPGIVLINGVLELIYVENRGAAFGIMQNSRIFFAVITVVILAVILYIFIRMPACKRYYPLFALGTVLSAGAAGNFIDRSLNGYVVDFIYFSLINFPVFNFADICVTVSTAFIIFLIAFRYKEDEFEFLKSGKKSKNRDKEEPENKKNTVGCDKNV